MIANQAARDRCAGVTMAEHSEIVTVPAVRLETERTLLKSLPSLRLELGKQTVHKVDRLACIRFASRRHSVRNNGTAFTSSTPRPGKSWLIIWVSPLEKSWFFMSTMANLSQHRHVLFGRRLLRRNNIALWVRLLTRLSKVPQPRATLALPVSLMNWQRCRQATVTKR